MCKVHLNYERCNSKKTLWRTADTQSIAWLISLKSMEFLLPRATKIPKQSRACKDNKDDIAQGHHRKNFLNFSQWPPLTLASSLPWKRWWRPSHSHETWRPQAHHEWLESVKIWHLSCEYTPIRWKQRSRLPFIEKAVSAHFNAILSLLVIYWIKIELCIEK